jgi:hypothetical protein
MFGKWLFVLFVGSVSVGVFDRCDSVGSQKSETLAQRNTSPASHSTSPPGALQQIAGKPIWHGMSGEFEIDWTEENLYSKSQGKVESILQSVARRGYDAFLADLSNVRARENQKCDYRRQFRVLSIVGPLLTFEDNEYTDCGGAHPTTELRFTLIDLSQQGEVLYRYDQELLDVDLEVPGKAAKLTNYFSEAENLERAAGEPRDQTGACRSTCFVSTENTGGVVGGVCER